MLSKNLWIYVKDTQPYECKPKRNDLRITNIKVKN